MVKSKYKFTEEHRRNLSLAHKGQKVSDEKKEMMRRRFSGTGNPMWGGDKVGYGGVHIWMRKNYGKPCKCEDCGNDSFPEKKYQWANIDGMYRRNRKDWKRLCLYCHYRLDRSRKSPRLLGRASNKILI